VTTPTKAPNNRILKDTKRAAQNRQAQRAFRERKDKHVRDLENKARIYDDLVARGVISGNEFVMDPLVVGTAREIALSDREKDLITRESEAQTALHNARETQNLLISLREEVQSLKAELADRDSALVALRRALEEVGARRDEVPKRRRGVE